MLHKNKEGGRKNIDQNEDTTTNHPLTFAYSKSCSTFFTIVKRMLNINCHKKRKQKKAVLICAEQTQILPARKAILTFLT